MDDVSGQDLPNQNESQHPQKGVVSTPEVKDIETSDWDNKSIQTPPDIKRTKYSFRKILFFIIIPLILITSIIIFVVVKSKMNLSKQPEYITTNQTIATVGPSITATPTSEWKTFKSEYFGFSFDYPAEWGVAEETMYTQEAGYSSNEYELTFSNMKAGNASTYYQFYPRAYNVSLFNPCVPNEEYTEKTKSISFSAYNFDLTAVCCNYAVGEYCGSRSFTGEVYFYFPDEDIVAIVLYIPTISEKMYRELFDSIRNNLCDDGKYEDSCQSFYTAELKEKELLKKLEERVGLDKETLSNLEIFDRISTSAKIN